MLIDFFYTLRAAKLPVSVKEYLMLLQALAEFFRTLFGDATADAASPAEAHP